LQLALLLLFIFWPAQRLLAQESMLRDRTLTTTRSVHQLSVGQAKRAFTVRLRATVTFYDLFLDTGGTPVLFVSDSTGSIYVALSAKPAVPLQAGDVVDITGVSSPGLFAPIIDQARARVIGRSALPLTAPRVSLGDLLSGRFDGQWVEVGALVHAVRLSGTHVVLDLLLSNSILTAVTSRQPGVDYGHLVDSGILLRAVASPNFNDERQLTGAHLLFPNLGSIQVTEPGASAPFQLPPEPITSLLRFAPNEEFQHRVHLRGAVTLLWPGRMICIQNGEKSLCGQTNQTSPLGVGALADVIGFPIIGAFTPNLVEVQYRPAGSQVVLPPRAVSVTARQALQGDYDARLVTIEARVIDFSQNGADRILTLSADGIVFTSVAPEMGASRPDSFVVGTLVAVTGVCSVQAAGASEGAGEGFTIPRSVRILQRSPADVVIRQRPSWWTVAHSLSLLSAALALIAFALGTIVLLRVRIKHQTATILAQLAETAQLKDAAEFLAMHDSLTGLYNREAIFAALRRELDLAARSGTTTGVLMLDLDHFKQINDTYGHAAGDFVLRESVRRILESVRSSDLVGRYGGEEFLVVLPVCDGDRVETCAERIRASIADEPMAYEGISLRVTASLGAVATRSPLYSKKEALITADLALYQAKNQGRNRVAFHDLHSRSQPEKSPRPG
jgi:diguanylate cyclase (GGDEF)-like protein